MTPQAKPIKKRVNRNVNHTMLLTFLKNPTSSFKNPEKLEKKSDILMK
jgi:hypothetical protein